jgi:L-seryl-tRNA(Ser) seleniumtransferase
MARSGATLKEVGTTNRTHLRDYEQAVTENTALLMKVHTSNFRVIGFTKEVGLPELRELADRKGLAVYEDLGSGSLFDFAGVGLMNEPTVPRVVAEGADVVSFSGDKVLGGPQAGIIVGAKKVVDRIKRNPLNRALRIDKMTLAALEATLRLYLDPELAAREVPTLAMIGASPRALAGKAKRLAAQVKKALGSRLEVTVRKGVSRVGGGAFPEQDLATSLVALSPKGQQSVDELKAALLKTDPPLVGRIEWDAFCLDPRTVSPDEFGLVVEALKQALV